MIFAMKTSARTYINGADLLEFAGEHIDEHVEDDAPHDARRNAVEKRHREERDVSGDRFRQGR